MNVEICEPKTKEEFEKYYEVRWRNLRKPWNQPKGSEKDELEKNAIHIIARSGNNILGVGRLQFNSEKEAQIRYMAVESEYRMGGIGTLILKALEKKAKEMGAECIILNARENAVDFYKNHEYELLAKSHTLFGSINHWKMRKEI